MNDSLMLTIAETVDFLKERDSFLILTHRRPDGDAIGCAGALAQGLRDFGKTAYVLPNPDTTPRYLGFVETYHAPDGYSPDCIVAVDTASSEMFPSDFEEQIDAISLCIDHHPSNTLYAANTCLDGNRASCGEIIYDILISLNGQISDIVAEKLYVALSSDTGCFAYANTTAGTLAIASLLVEAGAPHRELNKMLFRTKTRGRMKIEGSIYSNLEFYFDGAVAISTITRAMVKEAAATEDDIDDIASIPGSVEGVLIGITIRELSSTRDCKASVRTSPVVNASGICERFGGGGHAMAAGFTLEASVSEIKSSLLEILGDFLP